MSYPDINVVKSLLASAHHILILQADNPDGDSLASSLALEHLLGSQAKQVSLYCSTEMPTYLRYLSGWDRVSKDLPKKFDLSIVVDASTYTLFEKLQLNGQMGWIKSKPCIVLDHHRTVENPLSFAKATICDSKASSTGEVIYNLANQLGWKLDAVAGSFIMTAILGDTQGLSNDLASARTYRTMAKLIDLGVNRPQLEEVRRLFSKMHLDIFKYKAKLIERTEVTDSGRIAHVTIPQNEINSYSPLYNPIPLIQNDMLQISGVAMAIVFKHYDDGRITGAIRTNPGFSVADKLAVSLGGGGHPNASGFRVDDGRTFSEIKMSCLELGSQLLDNLS